MADKIKPGIEKAAAFLETHRYTYLMGGSMGFSKMEGTTVNIKDKVVDDFNGWVYTTSNFQHAGVGVLGTLGIRRFFCVQASTSASKQSRNVK